MKIIIFASIASLLLLSSFTSPSSESYSLTIEVNQLRNSKGVVQFALYDKDGSIPDEGYKKYYKISIGEIINNSSKVTFTDIPYGKYAVNILHDENENGKIDKGLIFPKEGIGFSNFQSIGFSNRPNFSKASFEIKESKTITVKVIYM